MTVPNQGRPPSFFTNFIALLLILQSCKVCALACFPYKPETDPTQTKKAQAKNHPKNSSQHKTTPPQGFFLWIPQDGYITPHNYLQKKFLFVAGIYNWYPPQLFTKEKYFCFNIVPPLILYMVRYYIVLGFVKFL